jgi:hypothetical protein
MRIRDFKFSIVEKNVSEISNSFDVVCFIYMPR